MVLRGGQSLQWSLSPKLRAKFEMGQEKNNKFPYVEHTEKKTCKSELLTQRVR